MNKRLTVSRLLYTLGKSNLGSFVIEFCKIIVGTVVAICHRPKTSLLFLNYFLNAAKYSKYFIVLMNLIFFLIR